MRSETKFNVLSLPAAGESSHWPVAALFAGYVGLQLLLLFALPLTYNEGIALQISRLIGRGHQPYTEIFTLSGPLFVWFVGWLGKLELSVLGIKLIFILLGGLLLVNLGLIAYHWSNRRAALATVFLLGTAVTFLYEAGTVVAVIPAVSIATLSLVLVQRYQVTGQLPWLVLSGLIWTVALFISAAALTIGLVVVLQLGLGNIPSRAKRTQAIDAEQRGRTALLPIGLWLAGSIGAVVIGLWLATPAIAIDILLADHATLWRNLPIDPIANFGVVGQFLGFNLWLFLFAIYGASRLYDQPDHPLWLAVIWGTVTLGWIIVQPTLHWVDAAQLLPPLAILAGFGLEALLQQIANRTSYFQREGGRWLWPIGIVLLTIYAVISYSPFNAYLLREIDTEVDFRQIRERDEIAAFIDRHTSPDECVIIDDAALAVVADRLPPPQLVGLSQTRIDGGLLTSDELATRITESGCRAIVFSKREYHRHFNDFGSWVTTYFPNEKEFLGVRINLQ